MKIKGNKKIISVILIIFVLLLVIIVYEVQKKESAEKNQPITTQKPDENAVDSTKKVDDKIKLEDIMTTLNKSGYNEDTLSDFIKIEKQLYNNGMNNSLSDISICYSNYVNNLVFLNKKKDVGAILERWNEAMETVYKSQKEITKDFLTELDTESTAFFYSTLTLGSEFDPLILKHTQNLSDFLEKAIKEDSSLPKFYYQSSLESLSYALLYNKKFEDYKNVVLKTMSIEDQVSGKLPEDTMPIQAYKYLIEGNITKSEKVINNFISLCGDNKINTVSPPRLGINVVIDDLYELKKRDIYSDSVSEILKKLPEPVLNITGVLPNSSADKSGIKTGDTIIKYKGIKCISYDNIMDLIEQYKNESKIDIEIMRENTISTLIVPGGKLGVSLEESIKK